MQSFQKPLTILLADDDKDDRFFFREAFKEIDVDVKIDTVSDGEQLIDHFSRPGVQQPHVLFLDLNLPRKNGLECLNELRKQMNLKDLIIAIYSTSSSERDIADAFSKGANLYIKKPNDFFSLVKIVADVMQINWKVHNDNLTKDTFVFNCGSKGK